jgi:hypothetical protein
MFSITTALTHAGRSPVPVLIVWAMLSGCTAAADAKPATKPEALKACRAGCVKSASAALGDERAATVYCAEMCTCLVDARFDKAGKQKKSSPEVFQQQTADCDARGRAKAGLSAQ